MDKKTAIEFLHFVTQFGFTYIGHNINTKPYTYTFLNDGIDPSSNFTPDKNKEHLTSIELFDMFLENRHLLDKKFLLDNH